MEFSPAIKVCSWQEIRNEVVAVNPTLSGIIDTLDPGPNFKLFAIDYDYGEELLDPKGTFRLPGTDGSLHPLNAPEVAKQLQKRLGYNFNTNPVCLVLKGVFEIFIPLTRRVVPFQVLHPGELFGLWKLFDDDISHCLPTFIWGLTAGARSLFLLPKVSDALAHKRLKLQCGVQADKPKSLLDHWTIFREIAKSASTESRWRSRLLLFSSDWFEYDSDPKWNQFYNYFLRLGWQKTRFWHNQFMWDLSFDAIQQHYRLKPNAYIRDMAKHILTVTFGALPGFRVADNDTVAPIGYLKEVYRDIYQLKSYDPLIMQPANFSLTENTLPVYLSLQYPSAMQLTPRLSHRVNVVADLDAIRDLLEHYRRGMSELSMTFAEHPLRSLETLAQFDFYHSSIGNHDRITPSTALSTDEGFCSAVQTTSRERLPTDSSFFKGCIKISSPVLPTEKSSTEQLIQAEL